MFSQESLMIIKDGASIAGLHLLMRPVLRLAEVLWKTVGGQRKGVTVTAGLDGVHSAGSWHYYGLALDFRTKYFDEVTKTKVADKLRDQLPGYDIVVHKTHIHVEPGDALAKQHGLLI